MLLALLPVAVLVAVSVVAVMDAWRAADNLRDFQAATRESFAAGRWPVRCRTSAPLRCSRGYDQVRRPRRPSARAQRRTDDAQQAVDQAASASSRVDAAGRLAAIRRQLQAPRLQAAAGATGDAAIADGYGLIVRDALELVRDLDTGFRARPPPSWTPRTRTSRSWRRSSRQTENAWMSRPYCRVGATEPPGGRAAGRQARRRAHAGSRLTTDLAASLFTPAGMRVTDVRLLASRSGIVPRTTLAEWLAA